MTRAAVNAPIALVEGPEDASFWRGRFAPTTQIVTCGGRSTAEAALVEVDRANIPQVAGVVDGDLDSILRKPSASANLIRTSTTDLETMLLSSPALEKVLNDLVAPETIVGFEEQSGSSIKAGLVSRCLIFGKLRYVDSVQATNVPFDKIPVYKFLDRRTWVLDEEQLITDFAGLADATEAEVRSEIEAVPAADPWHFIRGHDAMAALWILNTEILGGPNLSRRHLCMMLRLAYEVGWLKATSTYAELIAWEARSGARILS